MIFGLKRFLSVFFKGKEYVKYLKGKQEDMKRSQNSSKAFQKFKEKLKNLASHLPLPAKKWPKIKAALSVSLKTPLFDSLLKKVRCERVN